MADTKTQSITLNVAYVGKGGNTQDGRYFYSCVPNIINVTESDTPIQFLLSKDSQKRFNIQQVYCSDAFNQISLPENALNRKSIEITHKNTHRSLTFFSIEAYDNDMDAIVNCDPQATNVPPTR